MAGAGTGDEGRVAIIAGGGNLAVRVAEVLARQGRNPFVFAIEGEADPALLRFEHKVIGLAQFGTMLSILRRVKPADVVMIGGIRRRPPLRQMRPDWTAILLAARFLPRLGSGDDTLLRAVVETIEQAGFRVRGVHELVPELLAEAGQIAGPLPGRKDREAIATAAAGALALGRLDAGQACVAIGRRIVALEGAEGTDAMLARVADLRAQGRLPKGRGGALVKLAKPGQELRADLPTIGVTTVENAAAAGLNGIGVHAGRALIADHELTCSRASERGLFVVGVIPGALPEGQDEP